MTAASTRTKPISRLRVPDADESMPPAIARSFDSCKKGSGFVPFYSRAHSQNGENLARLNGHMLPVPTDMGLVG